MGLYSTVFNTCPLLGEEFLGELQTKELESLMDTYWLTTDGCLYLIDDSGTYTLERSGYVAIGADNISLPSFDAKPTGRNGRLKPYRRTGVVRFTASYKGEVLETVTFFRDGRLDSILCKGPIFSCNTVQE